MLWACKSQSWPIHRPLRSLPCGSWTGQWWTIQVRNMLLPQETQMGCQIPIGYCLLDDFEKWVGLGCTIGSPGRRWWLGWLGGDGHRKVVSGGRRGGMEWQDQRPPLVGGGGGRQTECCGKRSLGRVGFRTRQFRWVNPFHFGKEFVSNWVSEIASLAVYI